MKRLATLFGLVLCATLLWAGDVTIRIIDRDLDEPLEGVTISLPGGVSLRTAADGTAVVHLEDSAGRQRLGASLIGYDPLRFWVEPGQKTLDLKLALSGFSEGQELVVEQAKPGKTDAQSGVSQVITRDEIKSTAQIGVVEDLMSSIRLLPGVGYNGRFSAAPSIRGGAPAETKAVLDGGLVWYPYQWGGAVSIFDPTMIESAKLSNGLISSRYGNVISGMLEVNSRSPETVTPQMDIDLSTTGLTLFGLLPFGEEAGLMLSGKVTWISLTMKVFAELGGMGNALDPAPFIANGFARFYWKPSNVVEWDINGFVGNDGVGVNASASRDAMTFSGLFNYSTLSVMATTRLKALLGGKVLLDSAFSWNRLEQDLDGHATTEGTLKYDQDFIDRYGPQLGGHTEFTLKDLSTIIQSQNVVNLGQAMVKTDIDLAPGNLLSIGIDANLQNMDNHQNSSAWVDHPRAAVPAMEKVTTEVSVNNNKALQSGAYALWEFNLADGLVTGELGARVDHSYLFNDTMSLNTYPAFNPRLRLSLNAVRNLDWVERFSVTAGSGLYSQLPVSTSLFDTDNGLKDFDLGPDKAWFSVLGLELLSNDGWKFSAEGYYKQYFERFYMTRQVVDGTNVTTPHRDGTGRSWGIDLMIQKRLSRYWDGWLTYSYNDTKYLDPATPAFDGQRSTEGYKLGQEVYPGFHRFHTMNIISDWKPVEGFSIMAKATLASGTPRAEVGEVKSYLTSYEGIPVERFTRDSVYSDTLRTDLSCPIDIKVSFSGYIAQTKIQYEWYVAVQDVLVNLYSPKGNDGFDSFTGQTYKSEADFNVGFPLPSFGFKLSL